MDIDFHTNKVSSGGGNVIVDSMSNDLVKMQSGSNATGDTEKLRQMQDLQLAKVNTDYNRLIDKSIEAQDMKNSAPGEFEYVPLAS